MNKEQSIQASADNANRVHEDWTNQAYQKAKLCLTSMKLRNIKETQICDLRHCIDVFFSPLPEPPSKRSWGTVARRLRDANLIKIIGNKQTNNRKAHNAIAANYEIL